MALVGVVFGGRSVEHRVSVASARAVAAGLAEAGHQPLALAVAEDGGWAERAVGERALRGELDAIPAPGGPVAATLCRLIDDPPEVVFPLVHGTWGEDGTLQGLCEMLDLPYAGAGVAASAVAMDKLLCKRALSAAGLPVVEFEGVTRAAFEADAVHFALRFDDAAVVERGVAGRELECAVLGYRRPAASAVGEIVPGGEFYDYEDKYLSDRARLIAPAELDEETTSRARSLAIGAFTAIGGTGMARVDLFLQPGDGGGDGGGGGGGRLFVNEINTLPGFTRISMYPRLWALSGLPLPGLLDRLVDIALRRHADRHRLDAGIREWLAGLPG
jgi:D-alanine-D-alanine ligase